MVSLQTLEKSNWSNSTLIIDFPLCNKGKQWSTLFFFFFAHSPASLQKYSEMQAGIFLQLKQVSVKLGATEVLHSIDLIVKQGEQWAITGPSGSGKTVLAHTLAGRHFFSGSMETASGSLEQFHRSVMVVEQQHRFKDLTNRSDFYYQQRFNSFDAEQTVTVSSALAADAPAENGQEAIDHWVALLGIEHLLQEPLIQLSNGENKRLQLAKALLQQPSLLILDNPFIGLDTRGRELLHRILDQLAANGLPMIVITTPQEIPACITHVATLQKGQLISSVPVQEYQPRAFEEPAINIDRAALAALLSPSPASFQNAVRMVNVQIQYEGKRILQEINWEVKKGERWSVSGSNGAGKSTLLSLITGDNPQAYANEIYLFDRRRGSGESIWDIKKNIGYVSPELHLYFDASATCFQAVASGLFDTIGLFRQVSEPQTTLVQQWLRFLGMERQAHHLMARLSAGEQRLVLLARALIKHPPLLILDEPCQGLDAAHTALFKEMVDTLCALWPVTLIYVSHYQEEIPGAVNRHLQLEKGRAIINQ